MTYENQILLGRITRIHGYDGTMLIKLEKAFVENIPEMESVFLEIDGRPVPFFISSSDYQGGDILKVRFDGYHSCEKVSEFNGCRVHLTTSFEIEAEDRGFEEMKGFTVLLKNKKNLGRVDDIIQNPGQFLLRILTPENKEILVPLHEDFIVRFEAGSKTITLDLPDGLIELNSPPEGS